MRSFTITLLACLAVGIVNSQFNNGQGSFFTFNLGGAPTAQAAPAVRPPPQAQPQQAFRPQPQPQAFRQPAPAAQPAPLAGGAGGCTPSPNYQSGNRNLWLSWRGKLAITL